MVITCMQKKVRIKSNSIQNAREITCMQKRVNIKSNSMQEAVVVTCMKREGQGVEARAPPSLYLALMVWLASMERFFAKHIHVSHLRCVHRSHFQSGFLNYSSREQSIHPFTFTDSCKLKQMSETLVWI